MKIFLSAVLLALVAVPTAAQTPEVEVREVVIGLFDAMRAADGAAAAALFHPQARLSTVAPGSPPRLRTDELGGFLEAVAAPRENLWDERIANLEIRVDGPLATAWMDYAFFVDDRFSHCGVNAFQLFREPAGWKIVQLVDTRRREGCDEIQRVARRQ